MHIMNPRRENRRPVGSEIGGVIEMCTICSPQEGRIPVAAGADFNATNVELSVDDVGLGTWHSENFRHAFGTPRFDKDKGGRVRWIVIPINTPSVLVQDGTYDVLLRIAPRTPRARQALIRLSSS